LRRKNNYKNYRKVGQNDDAVFKAVLVIALFAAFLITITVMPMIRILK
tara:strand:+ start:594 stop:737 length:144 start_codon:yes stop_codon:yes gene_type:complete